MRILSFVKVDVFAWKSMALPEGEKEKYIKRKLIQQVAEELLNVLPVTVEDDVSEKPFHKPEFKTHKVEAYVFTQNEADEIRAFIRLFCPEGYEAKSRAMSIIKMIS